MSTKWSRKQRAARARNKAKRATRLAALDTQWRLRGPVLFRFEKPLGFGLRMPLIVKDTKPK